MAARDLWERLLVGGWDELSQWRVDQMSEGLHLDFKDAAIVEPRTEVRDTDRKNLAKGISGFANTEGGILIFGAKTIRGAAKEDVLHQLSGVSPLDVYAEKMRAYVQTITTPIVPGVDVRTFEDPNRPNTGVVGVFTPMTDGGPYRAEGPLADVAGKYFIRTTSDTTVMSHQLLASMFGRRPSPQLRAGIRREVSPPNKYLVLVENLGRGGALTPFVRIRVYGDSPGSVWARGSWLTKQFDACAPGTDWQQGWALPPGEMIYPQEVRQVAVFEVRGGNALDIEVRIDCENAQPLHYRERLEIEANAVSWLAARA